MRFFFCLIFVILLSINSINLSFAENSDEASRDAEKGTGADEIQQAFEKAMRGLEADRQKEQEKTLAMLKSALDSAVETWIDSTEKKWSDVLNKYVDQKWETLDKFGSSIHYDYYLRDFAYTKGGIDIIKTDSLMMPYKAYMYVTEKLYVERYHTPDASDVAIFFYTFTNTIKASFEYRDDRFVFTNAEQQDASLDPGWPAEIRALRYKYGERFRVP